MKSKEFNELIKNVDLHKIIRDYANLKINLTKKQVNKVIDLKNKKRN